LREDAVPREPLGTFTVPVAWSSMIKDEQLAWTEAVAATMLGRIGEPGPERPGPETERESEPAPEAGETTTLGRRRSTARAGGHASRIGHVHGLG
jgi:hypothetical protein